MGVVWKVPCVLWELPPAVDHDLKRTESDAINYGPGLQGGPRSGED